MDRKAITTRVLKDAGLALPESLPADGFSRWNDLVPFLPFSRETVRKRELEGRFPRRQHLSQRCAVWSNRAIHAWMADPVNYRAGV